MMNGINTNLAALGVQRALSNTSGQLDTAMHRLSSGLRINSARDDAAGQAIASRMTAQVRGHFQGIRNLSDGISLAQTAEGGLDSITQNLQRIRELAVQAANFTQGAGDRAALQSEISQLRDEITRVASQTAFNGTRLLDGSFMSSTFQAGANVGETISIGDISDTRATNLGQNGQSFTTTQTITTGPFWETNVPMTVSVGGGPSISLGALQRDASQVAAAINASGIAGLAASANPLVLEGSAAVNGQSGDPYLFNIGIVSMGGVSTGDANLDRAAMASQINNFTDLTGVSAIDLGPGKGLRLISASGRNIYIDGNDTIASWFGLGGLPRNDGSAYASGVNISYQIPEMTLGNLVFTNTGMNVESFALAGWSRIARVDVSTAPGANVAIAAVDAALQSIGDIRARLGAAMNRFEASIGAQRVASENQAAARSRIEDTDFAIEVANRAYTQILRQSGLAVLAQANAAPRNVLALLGG
jgi:flagellin